MTDLATRPDADDASTDAEASTVVVPADGPDAAAEGIAPPLEWAPAPPAAPHKRRRLFWIGVPVAVVVALVGASLILIAPGTTIAGVPVGGLTAGGAADAVHGRLADTTITFTGAGREVELTGAQLGASVDARGLADAAFAARPMWNTTTWFATPFDATVSVDADTATRALRRALPALYTDPVNAALTFDAPTASYVVTPAEPGEGVDVGAVRTALQRAFTAGETRISLPTTLAPVPAKTPTSTAQGAADRLNAMLDTVGFYVGAERTVPIDRAVAASWLTLSTDERGAFQWTVDQAAVQKVVDTLPAAVDRAPVNATVITDSAGTVLRDETVGVVGRVLESTDGVAKGFAKSFSAGDPAYALPVTETPFTTTALARRFEVDISEQRVYLFENEQVVQAWWISSGLPGNDTSLGHFRISSKLRTQNMGNPDLTKAPNYYTPNVPWVMYYNGDEALHGAYWHNNFGNQMSHGCVNMPLGAAEFAYAWAPMGTEVWVHS